MKLIDNPAIKLFCALVFSLVIIVTSCKTPVYTSFAPFDARLEPVPDSVAKYLIFLNTDGRTLHNYNFSAYLWNDDSLDRRRWETPIKRYMGSGAGLLPGQSIRFHPLGFGIEDPLPEHVTRWRSWDITMKEISGNYGETPHRANCSLSFPIRKGESALLETRLRLASRCLAEAVPGKFWISEAALSLATLT